MQPQQAPYNQTFLTELEKLNPAQRQAVETTEGPVLVIAGPGTGKTQVLAARIGYILLNTDSRPENILCLTYTDAGALAMRNRLTSFIGPDAYRVKIETFHSFCNEVIQENPDYFGYRGLQPVSDLEKIEVLQELVDSFDAKHPLKRWTGEVYYETTRLDRLFQLMKQEDWTAEFIEQKIKKYLDDLPYRDEFIYKRPNSKKGIQVGDLKTDKIEQEQKRMEQLAAAAREFDNYQQLLRKRQRYDFADMILWVLQAFKQHPDMLYTYQERFLYFLVDEFQDTSGSQNELLSLLTDFWDTPNVFAVGDDDQAIYRFQGANVKNIEDFALKHAEMLQVIVLTQNYRSVPNVLKAAHNLIGNNRERLINHEGFSYLKKELEASHPSLKTLENKPVITAYANTYHEIVDIAHQLEKLKDEGADLRETAIIYRNHRQCDELVKYLEVKKVPYYIKKKINLLNEPLIYKLITILRYIAHEQQTPHSGEYLLFEIMHFDFFGIPPIEAAKLSLAVSKQNYKERNTSFREELLNPAAGKKAPTLFDQHFGNTGMKRLGEDIDYWLKQADNLTLPQLLEKIINNSGVLATVVKSTDKFAQLEMLKAFFDFVQEEFNRKPTLHVDELIHTLDLMYDNNIELAFTRTSGRTDGVNLITAHSSKGLEYEQVFLLGCNSNIWDKGGRSGTYTLPDTIISDTVSKDSDTETEEARRLFFVALTRAKKQLHISYSLKNPAGKELERSRFVAEVEHLTEIEKQSITLQDEELSGFIETILQPAETTEISLIDKQYLDELLKNYSLSVTHLSNYLRCPVAFYFNNILRVPAPQNEYMAFGSAVHNALEEFYRTMLTDSAKRWPSKEQLLNYFRKYMGILQNNFIPEQYKRRMQYGIEILPAYYDKYINEWNKIVTVERVFRNILVEGVPLNGKMDKIEFDGKRATVVDYKTGNPANAKAKLKRPIPQADSSASPEDLYGGDYWRQAIFYKLLMDYDSNKDWEMLFAEFDFVEPDKKTGEYVKERIEIQNDDIIAIKQQIKYSYEGIKNHRFDKGCGLDDCEWCNFIKFNQIGLV
ncbi:MAG: ATP-dependent helicase [Bacteroidetes bacterium]|nr:MAG: ATP-dependent helicase [Bacteroidota bacterium]